MKVVFLITLYVLCCGGLLFAQTTSNGQRLYVQSCASCHDAHSTMHKAGPGLKGYYGGHHPVPVDAQVRVIIAKGKGTMPGFSSFSPAQMNDLIAYLKTL
jgi:mono/diheme cytochrome c family protein